LKQREPDNSFKEGATAHDHYERLNAFKVRCTTIVRLHLKTNIYALCIAAKQLSLALR
jgi:hypothetical protein